MLIIAVGLAVALVAADLMELGRRRTPDRRSGAALPGGISGWLK